MTRLSTLPSIGLTLFLLSPARVPAQALENPNGAVASGSPDAIRPFRVNIPEEDIVELRRRAASARWPRKELVGDRSQGVQLATLKALANYWTTDYDWRRAETRLNAYPQFVTKIDGVDIHFIHVKSRHSNAMPMLLTHG